MGILRLYLALCVVFVHARIPTYWTIHDGTQAVQIFFMISGFYMQLIWGKYANVRSFWASRFSRIYIPYFVCLFIAAIAMVALGRTGWPSAIFENVQASQLSNLLLSATNFTLIGMEQTLFVEDTSKQNLLIIPQAWTVALEIYFYLLVPFLAGKRDRVIWLVFAVSLGLRIACYQFLDLTYDPWVYRFFPFELALFSAGMLCCRYRHQLSIHLEFPKANLRYFSYCVAALIGFWVLRKSVSLGFRFLDYHYLALLSYIPWMVALPTLFAMTKKNQLDRFIGELSYPVYLIHMVPIAIAPALLGNQSQFTGYFIVSMTIGLSLLVLRFVVHPLDKWRLRFAPAAVPLQESSQDPLITETSPS